MCIHFYTESGSGSDSGLKSDLGSGKWLLFNGLYIKIVISCTCHKVQICIRELP